MELEPKPPLEVLLGTASPQEQAIRVQQLLTVANTPTLVMTIHFDQRNGDATVSASDSTGKPLPFEAMHSLLDVARRAIIQMQITAQLAAKETHTD